MSEVDIHRNFSNQLQQDRLHADDIEQFQRHVYMLYQQHRRRFPWRETTDPYSIIVSEIMLQQTQANRVIHFYERFITALPNVAALAKATSREVLTLWSGLGYNRRAVALHNIARLIQRDHNGIFPASPQELQMLPGIGVNTAGSIAAFAFNYPSIFIETNIRTVFLHLFFRDQPLITDKQILPLIMQSLDKENTRIWYYALMDYGNLLKKEIPNPNRNSKHYTIQSKFIGSDRRVRGAIIRHLTQTPQLSYDDLSSFLVTTKDAIATSQEQFDRVLKQLYAEQMIVFKDNLLHIHEVEHP
jgi:A/G-specific adenine glycosylase